MQALADRNTVRHPIAVSGDAQKGYDFWLCAVIVMASMVSIGATIYYLHNGEVLLYNDAYAHLLKARSVFDSLSPGFAQMGDVWLPAQHVLMLPFIWNEYLWQTGLAGTIPSMASCVITAGYLFCILRRMTRQIVPGLLGVSIFLTNPNILYLQSTPLTEVMCAAAFAATAYYLLRWLQEEKQHSLAYTGIAVCMATLIRYDGWALFLVVTVLIAMRVVFNRQNKALIDHLMVYLAIAPLGMIFWLLWNAKLSGDALYFYRGPYSAQAYQLYYLHKGELPTYHHLLVSLRFYGIDVGQTLGWGIAIAALLSLGIFLLYRKQQEYFIVAILLLPFAFYVITLYSGSSIIELPGAGSSTFFNVRYGAQMVLPAAFLIARGMAYLSAWVRIRSLQIAVNIVCLVGIGLQITAISASGILSLQDGLVGISCNNPAEPVIVSLSEHYTGGRMLTDEYTSVINPQLFGAHFSDIVYEGSGVYWNDALAHPDRFVNWIVLNPADRADRVARLYTGNKQRFLASFRLIATNPDGLQLYYRRGAPPLPTRTIPDDLLSRPHTCKLNE